MALLRARGEPALTEARLDEAWRYATQSLELATQSDSRKHMVRAQLLQGDVLAASGHLDEAASTLDASIRLAELIGTPREVWMGKASLGKVLIRLNRDNEAEAQLAQAAQTIEIIARDLRTPRLRDCFLAAAPVVELYDTLGHRPPPRSF